MFLKKRTARGNQYWSLTESYRENGKIKHRTVKNLGNTANAIKELESNEEYKPFLVQIKKQTSSGATETKIERFWHMADSNTFNIKPFARLLQEEMTDGIWIDPFANMNKLATITNDLNPEMPTDFHMDALEFLKMFQDASVDGVLYDPPYSPRQVSECYKGHGIEVTKETTQSSWWRKHKDEIARILKPGGMVFCFGWNSQGVGKKRGMDLKRVMIVAHGAHHNDTICTVEIKAI
ncbi:hypothetical protein P9578_28245 [Brevibacillus choshinensis]|uniref:hypothetical protein n=1 Tax=Brevibacillus choshinensis TaxID=54911 RepID=UPI002E216008|nr:hypothetical protein [Brevibacillus choshinensis]